MDVKSFVEQRILRLREKMEENGLEAVVLRKPENVFYFSNFNPVINSHPAFVVITQKEEPCLLVHCLRCDHARAEGALKRVELYGKWGASVSLAMRETDAVRLITGDLKGKLGLETDTISLEFYRELMGCYPAVQAEDISMMVNQMKIVKDAYEIGRIRDSAALVDEGVKAAIQGLCQGMSEAEASTKGQHAMRLRWHEGDFKNREVCGFGTSEGGMIDSLHVWCLSNSHIAYGCDCPKHYQPRTGDLCLPMAWAKTDGYHAENERTVIVDRLDSFRQNAYDSMLRARESIFAILKPGVRLEELYEAAAKVYEAAGFGGILPGRVGHGVGCSAHEFPSLASGNPLALKPGMAITVEPGLMDKAWGGVRHSDTVLITEHGYEILTKLDRGQLVIHIG